MNMDKFEGLLHGIQNAVINANHHMREQYMAAFEEYFDENNSPKMININYPTLTKDGVEFMEVSVPKLTLVPIYNMKMKEIKVDFKIPMSQLDTEKKDQEDLDQHIQVQIKMEDCETPEGVIKINDYLFRNMP